MFIDLVGYSKLLIEEQKERLGQRTEIVLATAQVREATNEKLVRLPTGDLELVSRLLCGQLPEAIAEYTKAAELADDPLVLALLAQGYAKAGQRDEALKLPAQLEQLAAKRYVGLCSFALVHLGLGEKEKASDDLERAYRERTDPYITAIKVDPILDPLRGERRFQQLVARMFPQNAQ